MDKKKSKQQDVLVIGAGASGMMTAITAARRGLSVTVLEHMDKPGKKILATGNGKCNFTNLHMSSSCYYGNTKLVQEILKQFTVEDLCMKFSISRSSLQNLFKSNIHITPKQYISNVKLNQAKIMIHEHNQTISEISDILGFTSIHYFSRKFKLQYGISPTDYAKSISQ